MTSKTLSTALSLREQGISTIPVGADKIPAIKWKDYQTRIPTEDELKKWFSKSQSIGLCAGEIQCLDFDEKHSKGIFPRFAARAEEVGLDFTLAELVRQKTPSGGFHLVWKCSGEKIGNLKLASKQTNECMIETRGEGGYFLIAPSQGYTLEHGDWCSIPTISEEDRDALLSLAKSFDERLKPEAHETPAKTSANSELTPGDDYDARADVPALLKQHGWKPAGRSGKYWTRPGKLKGISASWGVVPQRFYVHTTSTQFQPGQLYRAWHVYAMLECGGDYARAAGELRRQGFGGVSQEKKRGEIIQFLKNDPPAVEAYDDPPGVELSPELLAPSMPANTMTVWRPQEFRDYTPDPTGNILDEGFIAKGEWTSLVGVGGLGKSRIALWLCICQMTGKDWCGLKTCKDPKTAFFLSTENGVVRWKKDLEMMYTKLSEEERDIVDERLHILALTPEEEGDLNLGDIESVKRITATLQHIQPQLIVLDPFADMVDGDENSTADIVRTLRVLKTIHRRGAPDAAILVIHHARTGATNVAQAGDNYSAGNFGRGSKALYSRVRCELQLAPGSRDDANLLVLCCGKSNNAEKFAPKGIVFDRESFTYSVDAKFDLNTWRADVLGQSKGQSVTEGQIVQIVMDLLAETPGSAGITADEVIAKAKAKHSAGRTAVYNRIKEAISSQYLAKNSRGLYALGMKPYPKAA